MKKILNIVFIYLLLIANFLQLDAQNLEIQGDVIIDGRITEVTDPLDSQDVVTKAYLDQILLNFGVSLGRSGIQGLLNAGYSPDDLLQAGANKDDIYGCTYQGGIIFYLDDLDSIPNLSGLVAATSDFGALITWGCQGEIIDGADGTSIGSGIQNTTDISTHCDDLGIAAKQCGTLILNEYEDWFLPSRDALIQMYTKIGPGAPNPINNIGGFSSAFYWSSSESNAQNAWMLPFFSSTPLTNPKADNLLVRAVRAF